MFGESDTWPKYLPNFAGDTLIVMGVIGLNYGQLETRLRDLCACAIGMKPTKFYELRNDKRIQRLRDNMPADFIPELKEEIDYFLEGYQICARNRHAVMHSSEGGEYSDASTGERGLTLKKYSNKGEQFFCKARISDLRKVADDIHAMMLWGVTAVMRVNMFFDHKAKGQLDAFRKHVWSRPPMPTELKWEPLMKAPKPINKVSKPAPITIIIGRRNKQNPQ